jgi:hypothetical protein
MENRWGAILLATRHIGTVLNGQWPSRHPLGGVSYLDLDRMLNEQGSGRRILSDTLHHRPVIVKNEQGLRI